MLEGLINATRRSQVFFEDHYASLEDTVARIVDDIDGICGFDMNLFDTDDEKYEDPQVTITLFMDRVDYSTDSIEVSNFFRSLGFDRVYLETVNRVEI